MSGNWMAGQETELPTHTGNDPKVVEKTLLHNKKHIVASHHIAPLLYRIIVFVLFIRILTYLSSVFESLK